VLCINEHLGRMKNLCYDRACTFVRMFVSVPTCFCACVHMVVGTHWIALNHAYMSWYINVRMCNGTMNLTTCCQHRNNLILGGFNRLTFNSFTLYFIKASSSAKR
jgi:hypothetical protein